MADGTIYQRKDGRWVAAISKGPRAARTTKARYCHSKREAREALKELRDTLADAPRTLTVSAYLDSWVRDARNIRPRTREGYVSAIRHHLTPAIGSQRLVDLTPLDVERMLGRMEGTRSAATVRHAHATLRRALGQAVRAGLLSRNVASRAFVDAPRVDRADPDSLSQDEIERILAALPDSGLEALVMVALGTGMRQGEQLGLAWENVGPVALMVERELARVGGRYERVELKTKRSRRAIPLSPVVAEALAIQRADLADDGYMTIATGPVFVSASGGPVSGSSLTHRWYRLLERAGVRRRPWKVLRATFASRLHDAGVPDRVIADLLGHSRTYTTQNSYISTAGIDAAQAVSAAFGLTVTVDSHRIGSSVPQSALEGVGIERGTGEPRRTRTFNQLIKSQLLYH
jgi:integrase